MIAVKAKLGDDATILHTRNTLEGVEIIAAVDTVDKKAIHWPVIPNPKQKKENPAAADAMKAETFAAKMAAIAAEGDNFFQNTYQRPGRKKQLVESTSMHLKNNGNGFNGKIGDFETMVSLQQEQNAPEDPMVAARFESDTGQKTAEFAQALNEEISTIEQSRQLWLQSEKRLDTLKRDLAELKEVLLRQELTELQEKTEKMRLEKAAKRAKLSGSSASASWEEIFSKVFVRLTGRGVSREIAEVIVARTKSQTQDLDLGLETDLQRLQERFAQVLMEMIPIGPESSPTFSAKVMAMIGPAQSGKTLTSVKLAVNSALLQNKRVALILVSNGGTETAKHLGILANVAQIPLVVVQTPDKLKSMINAHSDKDLILIDFALEKKKDTRDEKLYTEFLAQIPSVEVHLVLPACLELNRVRQILKEFSHEKYSHLLLTHLDEMNKVGSLLAMVRAVGKPLSYICNGTVIPDHIEPANAAKLTRMILRG